MVLYLMSHFSGLGQVLGCAFSWSPVTFLVTLKENESIKRRYVFDFLDPTWWLRLMKSVYFPVRCIP